MQGKYDTAYVLLKNDYRASKKSGYYDNAANSLQWAARANLAKGNKTTALSEVREAFQLLKLWPDAGYLRNAYYTTTQIFREMSVYDSAFYYNNLWSAINDSLEKVVATSSLSISKARLNDETSRYNIQKLNREEKAELLKRNFIIAAIILISIIVFLYLNRSRIKLRHKQETADAEVIAAKEKLQLFTENIIEKTALIETLEKQVSKKLSTNEQQEIISALSSQTILTEADWEKFKTLYETIYPGFFTKLKTTIPDITVSEQRMAALIRLHLTTRQMASLLGISPNSVNKTKQRLRQRFNLPVDVNVEEFIIKL
jgi:DNA-binding CsgD family transcriptional regulator